MKNNQLQQGASAPCNTSQSITIGDLLAIYFNVAVIYRAVGKGLKFGVENPLVLFANLVFADFPPQKPCWNMMESLAKDLI